MNAVTQEEKYLKSTFYRHKTLRRLGIGTNTVNNGVTRYKDAFEQI
jgi:hypothetical protein